MIPSDSDKTQQLPDLQIIRIVLIVIFLSGLWIVYQLFAQSPGMEVFGSSLRWTITLGIGLLMVVTLGLLILLTWTRYGEILVDILQKLLRLVSRNQWIVWVYFFVTSLIFGWFLLGPYGHLFGKTSIRYSFFLPLVAVGTLLFKCIWPNRSYWMVLIASAVWYAAGYQILILLPGISSYPFTLTWSEGSAYYYASLFFSERIYGIDSSLPLINPSRHMLLAIPFLIDDLPIWVHRLWEVILWLIISGSAIALLVRRLDIRDNLIRWIYIAWVFIFLFQGPVYYFLLISLIPILWGFDSKRFKKTLLLVLIGSVWVGASRVNWIPFPGLLAMVLYFLEEDINQRRLMQYLLKPTIWVVAGTIIALFVWYGYANLSGNPVEQFGIYFTSKMLWYRLFPNATFKIGVLLATLIASIPLLGYIAVRLYKSGFNYHLIRRFGLGLILLVYFIGGMIVSTKIGGGNNIHNLDAYLFILLVTGSYLYFDKSPPDYSESVRDTPLRISNAFIILALLTPIYFTIQQGRSINFPKSTKTKNALLTIQEFAHQTINEGGQVLFIGERQLLTFNRVEGVPLIQDYERMFLMEMVMGGNEAYLNEFHRRIANQEFALIVTEPLKIIYKGKGEHFGEENDIYVHWVTEPVLCYYEPVIKISRFPIQLLIPRADSDNCP